MRISFVLPFVNLTGGVRMVLDLANCLHDAGHTVTVIYPCWPYRFHFTEQQRWGEFRKECRRDPGVPWYELRCRLLRVPIMRAPFLPDADVVVATAWPTVHDVARLPASRGRRVQLLMHHETGTGPEERICATYALPFCRIAISRFVRNFVGTRFGCHVDAVVHTGVNREVFFPDGAAEPRTVLFLYHPEPRKGAADAIEALSRLQARMPGLQLKVCGTVRPDHLPPWMPFEFHLSDAELRRRYSTSTALLYPSRHEGFGLPPLEAMACGCPSVTTAVGAVEEYASDGRDALIVPIGNVAAMADRLAVLLTDDALRARLSREGRRTAERLSVPNVAAQFAAALDGARCPISPSASS